MHGFKYHVRDRRNCKEREDIAEAASRVGGQRIDAPTGADLLIVHGNTDSPGKKGGLSEVAVRRCLERGGVYVEYTTGKASWRRLSSSTGTYSGSHIELLKRLGELPNPTSLDGIREAFDHNVITDMVCLPALAILCLGYLAVHADPDTGRPELEADEAAIASCDRALKAMGWPDFVAAQDSGKTLLPPELKGAEKRWELQKQMCKASWWSIFHDSDPVKMADREWGPDKSKGWEEVKALLMVIDKDERITPNLVADAYCTIAEKLGGK